MRPPAPPPGWTLSIPLFAVPSSRRVLRLLLSCVLSTRRCDQTPRRRDLEQGQRAQIGREVCRVPCGNPSCFDVAYVTRDPSRSRHDCKLRGVAVRTQGLPGRSAAPSLTPRAPAHMYTKVTAHMHTKVTAHMHTKVTAHMYTNTCTPRSQRTHTPRSQRTCTPRSQRTCTQHIYAPARTLCHQTMDAPNPNCVLAQHAV